MKYGSHVLRIGYQGIELMQTGELELPIYQPIRDFLVDVRKGEYSKDFCLNMAEGLERELEIIIHASDWPEQPDTKHVQDWMIQTYLETWKTRGYC